MRTHRSIWGYDMERKRSKQEALKRPSAKAAQRRTADFDKAIKTGHVDLSLQNWFCAGS